MNVKICKNTVFAYKNTVNNNPLLKKCENYFRKYILVNKKNINWQICKNNFWFFKVNNKLLRKYAKIILENTF